MEQIEQQLKFRAWNGEQMISPDYVDRNGVAWWKENSIPTRSEKVMQYIGKKDINGKEIYEGDIIKCADQNCVVVFGKVTLGFGYHFNYDAGWKKLDKFYRINGKDKVIGNIYQNPKLVSVVNKKI